MTNKLVVVINRLKYQKLRKFYHMKWNSLYQITAASRTPDYEATAPQIPVLSVLCPQLNLLNPRNKIPGYATGLWGSLQEGTWVEVTCELFVMPRSEKFGNISLSGIRVSQRGVFSEVLSGHSHFVPYSFWFIYQSLFYSTVRVCTQSQISHQ